MSVPEVLFFKTDQNHSFHPNETALILLWRLCHPELVTSFVSRAWISTLEFVHQLLQEDTEVLRSQKGDTISPVCFASAGIFSWLDTAERPPHREISRRLAIQSTEKPQLAPLDVEKLPWDVYSSLSLRLSSANLQTHSFIYRPQFMNISGGWNDDEDLAHSLSLVSAEIIYGNMYLRCTLSSYIAWNNLGFMICSPPPEGDQARFNLLGS